MSVTDEFVDESASGTNTKLHLGIHKWYPWWVYFPVLSKAQNGMERALLLSEKLDILTQWHLP